MHHSDEDTSKEVGVLEATALDESLADLDKGERSDGGTDPKPASPKGAGCREAELRELVAPIVTELVRKELSDRGTPAFDPETTKQTIFKVVSGVLFDSGLLEGLVDRIVDEKVKKLQGKSFRTRLSEEVIGGFQARAQDMVRSAVGEALAEGRKELQTVVDRQVTAALSSENVKVLIDEKFRAISLYLKTEVIPKTVAQILKGSLAKPRASAETP